MEISDRVHPGLRRSEEIERILMRPAPEFAAIANADNSDVILYTTDLDRRLMYMSKSSWNVCRIHFDNWRNRSFAPMLTDHPLNDLYRNFNDRDLLPNEIQILECEVFSDEGERVQLEVRRTLLLYEDEPIGIIGLTRRVRFDAVHGARSQKSHLGFDFALADQLTDNERYVVQAVVNGELNKNIAKRCNVTERTIESRRARAMVKLHVKSLPELVRYWMEYSSNRERHGVAD